MIEFLILWFSLFLKDPFFQIIHYYESMFSHTINVGVFCCFLFFFGGGGGLTNLRMRC